jgi:hypothetical protein
MDTLIIVVVDQYTTAMMVVRCRFASLSGCSALVV